MAEQETRKTVQFKLDWKVNTLACMLLPCLLTLGFWQLSRAEEKEQLKSLFEQRKMQLPISINKLSRDQDLRYQQVRLQGEFINSHVLFLDNKINRGQFGYEVISPFKLKNTQVWVLINRGWIAADKSRRSLPVVKRIEGEVILYGEIYVPTGTMLSLGQHKSTGWPRVVQSADILALVDETGKDIFPYVVRINTNAVGAYKPNWVVVNVQPEKHIAYAFQWFAMAMTLFIIVFFANTNFWSLIRQRKG